jgi:Ca2+/Na+ antiporter
MAVLGMTGGYAG